MIASYAIITYGLWQIQKGKTKLQFVFYNKIFQYYHKNMLEQRRTFLRRTIAELISIYSSIFEIKEDEKAAEIFFLKIENLLLATLTDCKISHKRAAPKTITDNKGIQKKINTEIYRKFQYSGVKQFPPYGIARNEFTLKYSDFLEFKLFMQLLYNAIKTNVYNIFAITESRVTKSIFHEKDDAIILLRSHKTRPLSLNSKYIAKDSAKQANDDDTIARMYTLLVTETLLKDDANDNTVLDFLYCNWNRAINFIKVLFSNYHIEYCGFENIKICKMCKKMFLPQRSGQDRGIFCSQKCQKHYYDSCNSRSIRCIANQRGRVNTIINYLDRHIDFNDVFSCKPFPSINSCRACSEIESHQVKAGQCPLLLSNEVFSSLVDEYTNKKQNSRKTKPKK